MLHTIIFINKVIEHYKKECYTSSLKYYIITCIMPRRFFKQASRS
jgi:hypothetical protein